MRRVRRFADFGDMVWERRGIGEVGGRKTVPTRRRGGRVGEHYGGAGTVFRRDAGHWDRFAGEFGLGSVTGERGTFGLDRGRTTAS